ncbi:MAG TPA: type VI secretion system-associated FHA domain protein TagH [Steroidobacteraceae bacterium]|nr:type VI secretion system-associated FHA domain protein TagH [Steroidobacteraceae bacterium]
MISNQRRLLGERSTISFGAAGGTIGRAADNDWVLPDPERYVSAHHAQIRCSDGEFVLEDTSTNGVYVNDDERPVSAYGPYRLKSGDVLRFGEYQVVVAVDTQPLEASPPIDPVPTQVNVLESVGRIGQTDLGAALDLDELLLNDEPLESPSGSRLRPVNAYGQAVGARPQRAPATEATAPDEEAVARRIERLARAAAKARDARTADLQPALYDVSTGLQVFCRGAGISADQLPADAQTRLLHLVGQLFREILVGMKDLERARGDLRNRFRIELPADPEDTRPSLARSNVEELLVQVLVQHESRRLDAVQWLRESVETAKAHERATAEALRAAFVEFVDRFDPAELEARFKRASRRGKPSGNGESQYWSLFTEFYRNLTEMPPDHLPHTFVEAFANAYKKALLTPRPSST